MILERRSRGLQPEELLRGQTLRDLFLGGPLPAREALPIAADICRGLVHAHAAGVLHGDLSLANVMVGADGQVKLLDLGLSVALRGAPSRGGTPGFVAPEVQRGEPGDARSDIFAAGAILSRLLGDATGPLVAAAAELGPRRRRAAGAGRQQAGRDRGMGLV